MPPPTSAAAAAAALAAAAVVPVFARGRHPRRLRGLLRRVPREQRAHAFLGAKVLDAAVCADEVEARRPFRRVRPHDDGSDAAVAAAAAFAACLPLQLPLRLRVPQFQQLDHVVELVLVQLLALRDGVDQRVEVLGGGGSGLESAVADGDGGVGRGRRRRRRL